jgi:hypothetical protein
VVKSIVDRNNIPPYALAIPLNYASGDLDDLSELYEYTKAARLLVRETMNTLGFTMAAPDETTPDRQSAPDSEPRTRGD